ncbi:hypothetical protein [Streptomyces sp. DSM 40907]|uniref:hypothetical protein n=1 Tax=Streptomyces kutzneri TaxID=3051179 RepID=UPI0028D0356D|nr:hypothetical protein [Streptomyces sp. DSM 40907]
MLVLGFPAGSFGTNCYVLAAGPGGPCVVVDPGQDATAPVRAALGQRGLRLELQAGGDALLLTGDSLLADGLGRAFPPVGDPDVLAGSMSRVCGPRRDRTTVLPGHGVATTAGAVRPFL